MEYVLHYEINNPFLMFLQLTLNHIIDFQLCPSSFEFVSAKNLIN